MKPGDLVFLTDMDDDDSVIVMPLSGLPAIILPKGSIAIYFRKFDPGIDRIDPKRANYLGTDLSLDDQKHVILVGGTLCWIFEDEMLEAN